MKLRDHQITKAKELFEVLDKYNICYLSGEVRSGKTGTALYCAELFNADQVLVITKKKAIEDIIKQKFDFGFNYHLNIINYESVHKLSKDDIKRIDIVIYDEAHSLSGYPKPSLAAKRCKQLFYNIPCIFMSGTPATESYSQYYHQFFVSKYSPFGSFTNFYKWAKVFVDVKQKHLATHIINDYSNAKVTDIENIISQYKVVMTQADAGFTTNINETILPIEMPHILTIMIKTLLKDKVIEGKTGYILGDTPAKLKQKIHQIANGHCIIEKDNGDTFYKIFDPYKAKGIKQFFYGRKIAIMYYYKSELEMLHDVFGDNICEDIETFNTTPKNIAIQQSTTEGMNLSKADCLVYLNFGFSGKNYIQSRDRLTVKDRPTNEVYFVIEKNGINGKILKRIREKKDYNSYSFKRDYGI